MEFLDLPLEILPEIFSHIVSYGDLTSICLVNSCFRKFAVPRLYERAFVTSRATRFIKLFNTLSRCPHLALFVFRLEIRVPFDSVIDLHANLRHVVSGLKNCINLRSCIWTVGFPFPSDLLEALLQCKHLRELDLRNCYHIDNHHLQLLSKLTKLHRISLAVPNGPGRPQFVSWLSGNGAALRSLTLALCYHILTDGILEAIAPSLVNLEHLHLRQLNSFPMVTHRGVWAIISSSRNGLLQLELDVSPEFDMATLANQCISSGALRRLHTFTLPTWPTLLESQTEWVKNVVYLLSSSPLESFHVATTLYFLMADELWTKLILTHGNRLLQISASMISWEVLQKICTQCTKLEHVQLSFLVELNLLDKLAHCLSFAQALDTIHLKFHYNDPNGPQHCSIFAESQALSFLDKCGPKVTQLICDTTIWEVERRIQVSKDGSMQTHRTLVRGDLPFLREDVE